MRCTYVQVKEHPYTWAWLLQWLQIRWERWKERQNRSSESTWTEATFSKWVFSRIDKCSIHRINETVKTKSTPIPMHPAQTQCNTFEANPGQWRKGPNIEQTARCMRTVELLHKDTVCRTSLCGYIKGTKVKLRLATFPFVKCANIVCSVFIVRSQVYAIYW